MAFGLQYAPAPPALTPEEEEAARQAAAAAQGGIGAVQTTDPNAAPPPEYVAAPVAEAPPPEQYVDYTTGAGSESGGSGTYGTPTSEAAPAPTQVPQSPGAVSSTSPKDGALGLARHGYPSVPPSSTATPTPINQSVGMGTSPGMAADSGTIQQRLLGQDASATFTPPSPYASDIRHLGAQSEPVPPPSPGAEHLLNAGGHGFGSVPAGFQRGAIGTGGGRAGGMMSSYPVGQPGLYNMELDPKQAALNAGDVARTRGGQKAPFESDVRYLPSQYLPPPAIGDPNTSSGSAMYGGPGAEADTAANSREVSMLNPQTREEGYRTVPVSDPGLRAAMAVSSPQDRGALPISFYNLGLAGNAPTGLGGRSDILTLPPGSQNRGFADQQVAQARKGVGNTADALLGASDDLSLWLRDHAPVPSPGTTKQVQQQLDAGAGRQTPGQLNLTPAQETVIRGGEQLASDANTQLVNTNPAANRLGVQQALAYLPKPPGDAGFETAADRGTQQRRTSGPVINNPARDGYIPSAPIPAPPASPQPNTGATSAPIQAASMLPGNPLTDALTQGSSQGFGIPDRFGGLLQGDPTADFTQVLNPAQPGATQTTTQGAAAVPSVIPGSDRAIGNGTAQPIGGQTLGAGEVERQHQSGVTVIQRNGDSVGLRRPDGSILYWPADITPEEAAESIAHAAGMAGAPNAANQTPATSGDAVGHGTPFKTNTPAQGAAQSAPQATNSPSTNSAPSTPNTSSQSRSSGSTGSSSNGGSNSPYTPTSSSGRRTSSMGEMFGNDDDDGLNINDFMKDYDGDGKVSSKDRSVGQKRYNAAKLKRRGKKGKTSTVPQREDSPIRKKVLGALDESVNTSKKR